MRGTPIQDSFQSGEISKNVWGRVKSEVYNKALKYCENWVPQVQGPIRTRDGWQFRETIDPRNSVAKLFTFSVGLDQDFLVEVGDAFIIVRDGATGEQIIGGESFNLVTDPTYQSQLTFWSFTPRFYDTPTPGQPVDVPIVWLPGEDSFQIQNITNPAFTIILPIPEAQVGGDLRQNISVPTGTDILTHTFNIDYLLTMTDCDKTDMGAPTMADAEIVIRVGTTANAVDIQQEIVPIADVGSGNINFGFIPGAGVTNYWIGIGVRWNGTSIPPINPTACGELVDRLVYKFGPADITTALPGGSGTPVEFASPYTTQDLVCLQSAMDPGERELWFTSDTNNIAPYQLKFDGAVWTWLDVSAVGGFVAPAPNTWTANSWPSRVAIKDSRLWLANIPSQRATIWGSRAGDYVDFNGAAPNSADDPLLFPLSVAGVITALTDKKQLVINTDVSEVVGESTIAGNVITYNDFGFPLQTEWGSSCIQPVGVGRELIFLSPSQKILRTFADEGGTNYGWDGLQLNLLAEDLFKSRVFEMEWADDPAYQYLCVMGDGTITAATYYVPEKMVGFYRLTTSGLIKSVTVTNATEGAVIWAVIEREGALLLEKLTFNSGGRHALDSWVFRNVGPTGTVTGLDHLDGMDCSIVMQAVDPGSLETYWTVLPNATPVAGVITIANPAVYNQQVYVGLSYSNSIQLLDLENLSLSGTSQGAQRRWSKVYLRLNDSAVPLVEGQYPRDRNPATPMGFGDAFITDDVEIVDLGSGAGDITITQNRPLITEITAIFGKAVGNQV